MKRVVEILNRLIESKFWGEVTIRFQNGVPVILNKSEQHKLD